MKQINELLCEKAVKKKISSYSGGNPVGYKLKRNRWKKKCRFCGVKDNRKTYCLTETIYSVIDDWKTKCTFHPECIGDHEILAHIKAMVEICGG